MALTDQYNLTQDSTYRQRVEVEVIKAIAQVAQEAATTNYLVDLRRKQFVEKFIENDKNSRTDIIQAFIQLSVTNPTIATKSADPDPNSVISDSEINFVILQFVDTVAGVNVNNSNL